MGWGCCCLVDVEVEIEVVEEAGVVVRAVLEDLAERVEGVEEEEDRELGIDACRRDMLGSWGRGAGGPSEVDVWVVLLSPMFSSSSSSGLSSSSVSSVSSIAESSAKDPSSDSWLCDASSGRRLFW